MRHPKLLKLERHLKTMFDSIDDELEKVFGELYPLHPARAERGETSNKEHDGLFNIGADFSAGYGSALGRGYIVDISMVTLSDINPDKKAEIEGFVMRLLKKKLPEYFPKRSLEVKRDGALIKIIGDFSLGSL